MPCSVISLRASLSKCFFGEWTPRPHRETFSWKAALKNTLRPASRAQAAIYFHGRVATSFFTELVLAGWRKMTITVSFISAPLRNAISGWVQNHPSPAYGLEKTSPPLICSATSTFSRLSSHGGSLTRLGSPQNWASTIAKNVIENTNLSQNLNPGSHLPIPSLG